MEVLDYIRFKFKIVRMIIIIYYVIEKIMGMLFVFIYNKQLINVVENYRQKNYRDNV